MAETLKPCPFCGGEAKIVKRDVEPQGDPYYSQKIEKFVECTNCAATVWDGYFHEGFFSDEEATNAWNRRSDTELVEALEAVTRHLGDAWEWTDLCIQDNADEIETDLQRALAALRRAKGE